MKCLEQLLFSLLFVCLCAFTAQAQPNATVIVTAPVDVTGNYAALQAVFGPGITLDVTGPVVEAFDAAGMTTACDPVVTDLTNSIALVDRGACSFVEKVANAEAQGAIAVIVCNNNANVPTQGSVMGGDDMGTLTIPSVMIPYGQCQTIRAELTNGLMATLSATGVPTVANETCMDATAITAGVTTVDAVASGFGAVFNGGSNAVWYIYTPASDLQVTVRSCGLTDVDTRMAVLSGLVCNPTNCDPANLVVDLFNDDCDLDNDNFASEGVFAARGGTSYWVYFDDYWSNAGFDFEVVEAPGNQIINNLNPSLCPGESIIVNGVIYNQDNFCGIEIIENGSFTGIDSTIIINLVFNSEIYSEESYMGCNGDGYNVSVNNNLYNEANPIGSETLLSNNGCDSIVSINLVFNSEINSEENYTGCNGDGYNVSVNNNLYNEANPTGSETLLSNNGCDSIVSINLVFENHVINNLSQTLCPGEFIIVNGNTFNEATLTGSETISSGSAMGCDSTINIQLTFHGPVALSSIDTSICDGQVVVFGGQIFDEDGDYNLTLQNIDDCDSLQFNIDLTVFPIYDTSFTEIICEGESFSIGGFVFDSTDNYTVNLSTYQGCDSIVYLDLKVSSEATFGPADAGADLTVCLPNTVLDGNEEPSYVQGYWEGPPGANVENSESANTTVNALQDGENAFIWSWYTEGCPDFSSDTVVLSLDTIHPITHPDLFDVLIDLELSDFNPLKNDQFLGLHNWTIEILDFSVNGELQQNNDSLFNYMPNETFDGLDSFTYTLCNEYCEEYCSETTVHLEVKSYLDGMDEIAAVITPNGDDKNDVLIIDIINDYPNNQIIIFNRWGGQVYSAAPYQNDWSGQNQNGPTLPAGTYYFMVKLDIAEGDFITGTVTIQR